MKSVGEFLIRVSAFVRKEIVEAVRQPRLVAILILGPFLVLLFFGIGYTNAARTLRTMMVIPPNSTIRDQVTELSERLGGSLQIVDVIESKQEALTALDAGTADLVVVTPADPYRDLLDSEQSLFEVYHHEIDPIEVLYVSAVRDVLVEAINTFLLTTAIDQAKTASAPIEETLARMIVDAAETRDDIDRRDVAEVVEDIDILVGDVLELNRALAAGLSLYEGAQQLSNDEEAVSPFDRLANVDVLAEQLAGLDAEGLDLAEVRTRVEAMRSDLEAIDGFLSQFGQIESRVLVTPFAGTVTARTEVQLGPIDFYVPGVIALLLQHMAVTLGALSIVRERGGGSVELFRAAPVTAFETLVGKYISFLILGVVLAAVLTGLIILVLDVPMLGSWVDYAISVVLLLVMALGGGFVISGISETDTQAVQYSMIALLASVFFSGFFIGLFRFAPAVRVISVFLPATYGTRDLQEIMLRGRAPGTLALLGALAMSALYFLIAWMRLRKVMARQ